MTIIAEDSQEGWKSIREATDDIMQKKTHKYDNSEYNQINGDFNYCDNNINFYCKSTS